jgi:hypothetical protein
MIIELASSPDQVAEVSALRAEVFGGEWGVETVPAELPAEDRVWHLLALDGAERAAAGALTILNTSGNHTLHRSCGLYLPQQMRVARYCFLAVRKAFRGRDLPLQLMVAARERVVVPQRFDFSWLLFDSLRAAGCSFRPMLGFDLMPGEVASGRRSCRVLARLERAPEKHEIQNETLKEFGLWTQRSKNELVNARPF